MLFLLLLSLATERRSKKPELIRKDRVTAKANRDTEKGSENYTRHG